MKKVKHMRELEKDLLPDPRILRIEWDKSKHFKMIVHTAQGKFKTAVSTSPSDRRSHQNTLATVKRKINEQTI